MQQHPPWKGLSQNDAALSRRAAFVIELLNLNAPNDWVKKKKTDFFPKWIIKKKDKLFPRERSHQPSCCSKYNMDRFENLSCFIFCCTADNSWISTNREGKRITPPENISRGKGFMVEKTQISLELGVWRRELKGKHIFLCTELFTNWIQPVA